MSNAPLPAATPMQLFVGLSSVLTGIAADNLAPAVDPYGINQIYFDFLQKLPGNTFQSLLDIFGKVRGQSPQQVADTIFNQSGDAVRYFARSIMLMWYLGSWYDPSVLQKYNGPNPPSEPVPAVQVISPDAYAHGAWVWSVAQAHPMGYSNGNFGYWSKQPPSLSDFIGGGS